MSGLKAEEFYLFDNAYEKVLKLYKNSNVEVYDHTNTNRLCYLLESSLHPEVLTKAIEANKMQFRELMASNHLLKKIKQTVFIRSLTVGNWDNSQALELQQIEKTFNLTLTGIKSVELLVTKVPPGMLEFEARHETAEQPEDSEMTNEDPEEQGEDEMDEEENESEKDEDENSCIQLYFQATEHNLKTKAALELLEKSLYEEMFNILRNKEQLGYYVGVVLRETGGIFALSFEIESANYSPNKL